ncbi:MAG TPA: hypothetical protein VGM28_09115 [Candidatus Limnocylindrales bacterium]
MLGTVAVAAFAAPAVVAAHNLSAVYQSPLPLAVYLAGAATTVALSFVFVLARDMRAAPTPEGRIVHVPAPIRLILRALGLIGWAWILVQGLSGGTSEASVSTLFLWVYGWVGVAMLSALVAPVWEWVDPFTTLHDILAWGLRRLGVRGWAITDLPAAVRVWPAVAGLMFFIWLELVAVAGTGTLTVVLAGYTVLTLALMAQFGRDQWNAQGETFTVWFRTLNRLAVYGVTPAAKTAAARGVDADDEDPDAIDATAVIRRPFASGVLDATWEIPRVALVAIGTASIIFDGLSQTVAFATVFGNPALVQKTVILIVFLWVIAGAALVVGRAVTWGAIGAGLTPIAVGYLVAHYLTYLLVDGQRIVVAVSDPLQNGSDLFGTAFFLPTNAFLAPGLVWTVQLAAVVGGHVLGAWAGHVRAQQDMAAIAASKPPRDMRHRKIPGTTARRVPNVRRREVPLAVVMVMLTTLTLWSLGQSIVAEPAAQAPANLTAGASPH